MTQPIPPNAPPTPGPPTRNRLIRWVRPLKLWQMIVAPIIVGAVLVVVGILSADDKSATAVSQPTSTTVLNQGPSGTSSNSVIVKGSSLPESGGGIQAGSVPYVPGWSKSPFIVKNDYFSVTASMSPLQACVDGGEGWLVPGPFNALTPISYGEDADAWALKAHGVPYAGNKVNFTIQGLNGHTVIITHFGVLVVKRQAPLAGSVTDFSPNCGGVTDSYFRADLDGKSNDVSTKPVQGHGVGDAVESVVPPPHSVTEADPEQWFLTVDTSTCYCSFVPYFDYTSDAVTARFEIRLGDGPWEVSAAAAGSSKVSQSGTDGRTWKIDG